MQVILTEEEYAELKDAVEVARKDAKSLAAHMASEWVKKAVPVVKDFVTYGWNNMRGETDLLKRLLDIKLE